MGLYMGFKRFHRVRLGSCKGFYQGSIGVRGSFIGLLGLQGLLGQCGGQRGLGFEAISTWILLKSRGSASSL